MAAPNKDPADRLNGGGAEGDHDANSQDLLDSPSPSQFQATLETVAAWREDLTERIARTRLRHELIGVSPEDIINLAEEARDFKHCCRCLAWAARSVV
jgi:hypothetical protein